MPKQKNKKSEMGITLIALVVSIIVLIILAGVSIAMLVGENGIITQAQRAKEDTEIANIIERLQEELTVAEIESNGELTRGKYIEILENYGKIGNNGTTLITNEGNYTILLSDIYPLQIKLIEVTPVYAILYNNGHLVFNTTGEIYSGMTESDIIVQSEDISEKIFDTLNDIPWHSNASLIKKRVFTEEIAPITTKHWFSYCVN